MLTRLTKGLRARAAIAMAVFYCLCTLAPVLAVTIAPAVAAHCLTEGHQHAAQAATPAHDTAAHVHADGAEHEHGTASGDGHADSGQCCGIACISALPATIVVFAAPRLVPALSSLLAEDNTVGRASDLLYRPPISLLSL